MKVSLHFELTEYRGWPYVFNRTHLIREGKRDRGCWLVCLPFFQFGVGLLCESRYRLDRWPKKASRIITGLRLVGVEGQG